MLTDTGRRLDQLPSVFLLDLVHRTMPAAPNSTYSRFAFRVLCHVSAEVGRGLLGSEPQPGAAIALSGSSVRLLGVNYSCRRVASTKNVTAGIVVAVCAGVEREEG
jgi:hypothetical protein